MNSMTDPGPGSKARLPEMCCIVLSVFLFSIFSLVPHETSFCCVNFEALEKSP